MRDLGSWVDAQEGVTSSYFIDEGMILIDFENGLSTYVRFIPVDENGIHLVRGSNGQGVLNSFSFDKTAAKNRIKNEKILIMNPVLAEFYGGSYNKESLFKRSDLRLEVDVYNDDQVTLDLLNQLGDYGFIILNTHGNLNGFLLMELPEFSDANNNWTEDDLIKILANKHGLPILYLRT